MFLESLTKFAFPKTLRKNEIIFHVIDINKNTHLIFSKWKPQM